jgi:hypothetical protein
MVMDTSWYCLKRCCGSGEGCDGNCLVQCNGKGKALDGSSGGDSTEVGLFEPIWPPDEAARVWGSLGGGQTWFYGLLAGGSLFGSSALPGGDVRHAALYTQDQLVDLNTEFTFGLGWDLSEVLFVSDTGVLTGIGSYQGRKCGFVWTPDEIGGGLRFPVSKTAGAPRDQPEARPPATRNGLGLLAAPNPFRGNLEIRYRLPGTHASALEILDAGGRRVRLLEVGDAPIAAWRSVDWDGRDDRGQAVSGGVYFVRLRTGAGTKVTTVVRISR